MSDTAITPRREKNEPQLPPTGLLAVNPSDTPTLNVLAREHTLRRHFLFNAQLYSNDRIFLAGPAVGAPMAVLCLEKLIALGAQRIIVFGWCGSLVPALRTGDLFLPSSGLSEEGTSPHYQPLNPWDASLHAELAHLLHQSGYPPQSGAIWTTDALYRETWDKVERYAAMGLLAVDMEFTALQAVAAYRGIQLAATMLVSDELFDRRWQPGYVHKQFRTRSRQMLTLLFSFFHQESMP